MSRLLIKICGLTCEEDLRFCQDMEIDLTGFIFHRPSPRFVEPAIVGDWEKKKELRAGVFVDQDVAQILEIIDMAGLDLVQLHGGQTREVCLAAGSGRVIRVFWPERADSLTEFQAELDSFRDACRFFLFDAGKEAGGHGRGISSPWFRQVQCPGPFFLAGGLGPHNVEAVSGMGMAGLDLNSGVEKKPGQKDRDKIRSVLNIVRRKI